MLDSNKSRVNLVREVIFITNYSVFQVVMIITKTSGYLQIVCILSSVNSKYLFCHMLYSFALKNELFRLFSINHLHYLYSSYSFRIVLNLSLIILQSFPLLC